MAMPSFHIWVKLRAMINCECTINTATLPRAELKLGARKEMPVVFGSHGIKLHGTIMLPAHASAYSPVPGAVLCHGFGADRKVMESSALLLVKKGIATMVFDLRGHGLSEGCLDGNSYEDIIDAWQLLTDLPEVDSSRIGLIGHSLGAFSSILAARKIKKPKAIVALSCPSEVNSKMFKYYSPRALSLVRWVFTLVGKLTIRFSGLKVKVDWQKFLESWLQIKLSSALAELDECAKLFVFSASDLLSPYHRFAQIYQEAPGPKQKMLTKGSHVTAVEAEMIRFEWIGWAVSALKAKKSVV
jgi:pimeloyl-ACP methyl ester carboxylesterase